MPGGPMVVAVHREREFDDIPGGRPRHGTRTRIAPGGDQQASARKLDSMAWSGRHVFPRRIFRVAGDLARRGPSDSVVSAAADEHLLIVFAEHEPQNPGLAVE